MEESKIIEEKKSVDCEEESKIREERKSVDCEEESKEESELLDRGGMDIKGLHIDPCRHFLSCRTILKIIKYMHKLDLNTLHIHMSDDQGFPFESERYPELKFEKMLSIEDQKVIGQLCHEYGIDIIPEIDIPGHARAFLSIFREGVKIEKKLGVITQEYIDIEKDLPIIFDLFEEYAGRFNSKMIHMGGDEAKNFGQFPLLLDKVCKWGEERGLDVVAWDEVGAFLKDITPPKNLIIQRWRFRTSPSVHKVRCILSQGYYLDHCDDPVDIYNRNPKRLGRNIGCIACSWTELIDESNIFTTLFPSLYMIAHRWNSYPKKHPHPPLLLRALCDQFGYPKVGKEWGKLEGWKTRLWIQFYVDVPRSTSSLTVDVPLDREHDHYPVFSKQLIIAQSVLYTYAVLGQVVDNQELLDAITFLTAATGKDCTFIKSKKLGWKKKVKAIRTKTQYEQDTYKNGGIKILRRLCK